VLNNDLGIVVRGAEGDRPAEPRVDLFLGGSTAYQPDREGSVAQLAEWLGTVPSGDVNALLDSLLRLYRQRVLGERRPWRRWKYVVRRLGIAAIRDALCQAPGGERLQFAEGPPAAADLRAVDHPLERIQADGRRTFCLPLPAGRLPCSPPAVAALRRLAALRASVRIAPQHRLVIADVRPTDRREVLEAFAAIAPDAARWCEQHDPATASRANRPDAAERLPVANACPAFPSCPLAVDEAERVLPGWQQVVCDVANRLGVAPPRFALSGCGNGCSRPLTSEIGVIAERRGARRVFLGGGGTRLGVSVGMVSDQAAFRGLLEPWLARYAAYRDPDEPFADWFWRVGHVSVTQ
jgi:sulfite reductase (ferredoxin)